MAKTQTAPKAEQKKLFVFRLNSGNHSVIKDEQVTKYRPGDVIVTDVDLLQKNSKLPGPKKFEAVDPDVATRAIRRHLAGQPVNDPASPVAPTANADGSVDVLATIAEMNLDELQKFAAGEEIDLKGAKTKEAAFELIKASFARPVVG